MTPLERSASVVLDPLPGAQRAIPPCWRALAETDSGSRGCSGFEGRGCRLWHPDAVNWRRVSWFVGVAALGTTAVSGHVVYPLILTLASRRRREPSPPTPDVWPRLSVVVPAYREREVVANKVADITANGYPGALEVIVVADDDETAEVASRTGASVLTAEERGGKAVAMNRGAEAATGEIVVFTDANAFLDPGSLERLVRWFADVSVGGAAGDKRILGDSESMYWRFESHLKRGEHRLGSTIGIVGELAAVRRDVFRPLPAELAVDDLWLALDILEQGSRIVYERSAIAREEPGGDVGEVWERRTRVVSGTIDVILRRRELLGRTHGALAVQLWLHTLLRITLGPVAHALLLLIALVRSRRSAIARAFVAGHVLAAVALARERGGARLSAPERLVSQVAFLQLVALGGLARYLRGDRPRLWPKPARAASGRLSAAAGA